MDVVVKEWIATAKSLGRPIPQPKGRLVFAQAASGIERIAMLRYGINDIRLFFENDVRFLKQF